jgi:ribosomal-protein-alanine N-acetyltransferase
MRDPDPHVRDHPPVRLAALSPGDLSEVRAVEELTPSTRRLLPAVLPRPDHRWLVARTPDGRLAGVAGVVDAVGDAHVLDVVVLPGFRLRGLGRRLLRALLDVARDELGCGAATLEVRASNLPAQALYRRLGFVGAGTRPGYYPPAPDGSREDAIIMWLHDLSGAR